MIIRFASEDDLEEILTLWEISGLKTRPKGRDSIDKLKKQLKSENMWLLIGEEKNEIIGVVLVTHDSRKGWINRLAIHPEHQRKGHAKELLLASERSLIEKGIEVFSALIKEENVASRTLFEKNNYRDLEHVRYYAKKITPDS